MKIAIVVMYLSGGGSERFAVSLANGIVKNSHSVTLLTAEKTSDEYALDNRIYRKEILCRRRLIRDAWRIRSVLINERMDVVIAIGIYPNLCCGLANYNLGTKVILCERNDPLHDHLSWKSKLLRRFLFPNGDGYVFQTNEAKEFYGEEIQRRSIVIPNPILSNLPKRQNTGKKEFVAIGRLCKQKNYRVMLEAFAKVCEKDKEYILRIFGRGKLEKQLRTQAIELGIDDRVVFEGYCQDVHDRIVNSDIYIISSDFEGISNALMEAMAMGFPVISTDWPSGGAKVLIENGVNGILVPVCDCIELARSMLYLIENTETKERMGRAASTVKEKYSIDRIVNTWDSFINIVVAG